MDQDHQERIRQRAHEIWESEGRPEGRDADHWTRAQEELKNEMGGKRSTRVKAKPELEQTEAAAKPKRPRKTAAKSADMPAEGSESTPYLNDGP